MELKEKNINTRIYKGCQDVEDVIEEKRQVIFYGAKFNNIDDQNDMFIKGAFLSSIKRNNESTNRKIAFLRYHDWEHQIGVFTDLAEDEKGLLITATCGTSQKGCDAWEDYKGGVIKEHSVAIQYITTGIKRIDDQVEPHWQISDCVLWETSAVTFGSNSECGVVEVIKGVNEFDILESINKKVESLMLFTKGCEPTKQNLFTIENQIAFIQSKYNNLLNASSEDVKSQLEAEKKLKDDALKSQLAESKLLERKNIIIHLNKI